MKSRYFSTFQLILLALFAALIVVAKIALKTPLQLPGHSGIFWMAIVIVAAWRGTQTRCRQPGRSYIGHPCSLPGHG
jgi:membrane protein CcdC involved in cytochrome C biogenesis